MLFVAGLPPHHHNIIIQRLIKSLPTEYISGLPAIETPRFQNHYAEECLETICAFEGGRPNCFDKGLCILAVLDGREDASKFRERFFPFALFSEVKLDGPFATSPARIKREKNQLLRQIESSAKKLLKFRNAVSAYFQSRANRTPLLLPLRHFDEPELSAAIVDAYLRLPNNNEPIAFLEQLASNIENKFPFRKKRKGSRGNFVNSKNVTFTVPGRALHGVSHFDAGSHRVECHLNGIMRIGGALRSGFHYDCTKGNGRYSGAFSNCHDERVKKVGKPHLNVFPNDYIR